MGTNLLLFGFSEWFWLNLVGIAFIGIGGGLIESSSNPLLIQLFPGREVDGDATSSLLLCRWDPWPVP